MILHGRNIIISANGSVIASSKSCDISIDSETIQKVSSGKWKQFTGGRMSWSLSTGMLLPFAEPNHVFEAVSTSFTLPMKPAAIINDGNIFNVNSRGMTAHVFKVVNNVVSLESWLSIDTYEYPEDTTAATALSSVPDGNIVVIVSYDAMSLNSTIRSSIIDNIGVPANEIAEVPSSRCSFACVGIKGGQGVAYLNMIEGGMSHVKLYTRNDGSAVNDTPFKDCMLKSGTEVTLTMSIDGLPYDKLTGTAICKQAKVTGNIGNLVQGSFLFQGSGPLY